MELPEPQRDFVDAVLPRIESDPRIVGVAIAGSIAAGHADVYSDVDLVIAVTDDAFEEVMAERLDLIRAWTSLIVGFTGEHVGEPRLIVTLSGPPLLHVDYKFVRLSDFVQRIDDPLIVSDRTGALTDAVAAHPAERSAIDLQWIEDRFWVWVHYGSTKLGRGELFEVLSVLSDLRVLVLAPLAALRAGERSRGVRRLEALCSVDAEALEATVGAYDSAALGNALVACVELYRDWMGGLGAAVHRQSDAERFATAYLHDVIAQRSAAAGQDAENTSGG